MDTKQNALNGDDARTRQQAARFRDDALETSAADGRSSEEIKHRIDRTRGAMDETLNELGARLSPHSLLDDVMAWLQTSSAKQSATQVQRSVQDFGRNLGTQIRENPLPTLLIGAGVAWLAFGSRDPRDERDPYMRGYEDGGDDFLTEEEMLIGGYAQAAGSQGGEAHGDPAHAGLYLPPSALEGEKSAGRSSSMASKLKEKGAEVAHQSSSAAHSAGEALAHTAESVQHAASKAGEKVSHLASAAAHGVQSAVTGVGSALHSAGATTSRTARQAASRGSSVARHAYRDSGQALASGRHQMEDWTHRGGEQLQRVCRSSAQAVRSAHAEYPLAVGLGCLALGALAGLVVPRTRQEDEAFGETAEQFKQSAREAGREALHRGQQAVEQTLQTAKETAAEEGLTPEHIAHSAARVADKASTAAADAAKQEGVAPQQLAEKAQHVADETKRKAKEEAQR